MCQYKNKPLSGIFNSTSILDRSGKESCPRASICRPQKERRRWVRESLLTPVFAILYPQQGGDGRVTPPEDGNDTLLVAVLNSSDGGVLLDSPVHSQWGRSLTCA